MAVVKKNKKKKQNSLGAKGENNLKFLPSGGSTLQTNTTTTTKQETHTSEERKTRETFPRLCSVFLSGAKWELYKVHVTSS